MRVLSESGARAFVEGEIAKHREEAFAAAPGEVWKQIVLMVHEKMRS